MKRKTKPKHTVVTKSAEFLKKHPRAKSLTLAEDKDGFFVFTHRVRSNSYKSPMTIPLSAVRFIASTA